MEKEFVPYAEALALKKLGFDELCLASFETETNWHMEHRPWRNSEDPTEIASPLYQQAFRWFRENYNLRGFIGFRPNIKQFDCHVYDMSLSGKEYVKQRTMEAFTKDPKVGTYEEAELECLKKLIEIIKEKK